MNVLSIGDLVRPKQKVVLSSAPLVRNPLVDDFCGKPVLIKDCSQARTTGGFSSGTFKDYRSARLVNDFGGRVTLLSNPVLYSIVYTTAGYSLGMVAREYNQLNALCKNTGIRVVSLIDEKLDARVKQLLQACSVVGELPLQERIFSRSEIRAAALDADRSAHIGYSPREYIDAENYLHSYTQLAEEILTAQPDVVFMPLGGGEALNSLLNLLDAICGVKMPRIIAATIRANVYAGNGSNGESSIAEKLVTPASELYPTVSEAIRRFGEILVVEEDEIMPAYFALKNAGIKAEPSAAVAFAAARKARTANDVKILVVNSGAGIYFDETGTLRGVPDERTS